MAINKTKQNMGSTDRIVRGFIGSLMLLDGIFRNKKIETVVGGAFVVYAVTGFDPLLKALGTSTIPKAKDNILHQLMQVAPGKGINPMLTQQAVPRKETKQLNKDMKFADAIAIR